MRRLIGVLSSAALLAGLLAAATAPSVGAVTCTPTGFFRDGINMTAALINPTGTVSGEVDATGCNIGVFYGTGSGLVQGADIHGANYFGVAVIGDSSNVSVDVLDSDIHDIGESPFNGAQHGVAIYYRATGAGTATGTIARNGVWNYQKGGIVASNPGTSVSISGNTVTGLGPVGFIAQNGIQLGYGAAGEVKRNTVTDNWYSPYDWTAAGILVFEANDITVERNVVTGNQAGVVAESWCWVAPSASENKIVGNTISGAQVGVLVDSWALPWSTCNAAADNNKVVNNTITATSGDVGVYVGATVWSSSYSPSAANNKVIRNAISGYAAAFVDDGSETKSHANVFAP